MPALAPKPSVADLDQFCERYYPLVERRVRRLLAVDLRNGRSWIGSVMSTGDVVHDVFLGVVRDQGALTGRSEQAVTAYLGRLVRNRLVDMVRYHEASRRDGRRVADVSVELPAAELSPGTQVVRAEEQARLAAAMQFFTERERAILRARLEDGMPFAKLASSFGYASADSGRKAFHALLAQLVVRLRRGGQS